MIIGLKHDEWSLRSKFIVHKIEYYDFYFQAGLTTQPPVSTSHVWWGHIFRHVWQFVLKKIFLRWALLSTSTTEESSTEISSLRTCFWTSKATSRWSTLASPSTSTPAARRGLSVALRNMLLQKSSWTRYPPPPIVNSPLDHYHVHCCTCGSTLSWLK